MATQEAKEDRADLKAIIAYFERNESKSVVKETDQVAENANLNVKAKSDKIRSAAIMAVCGWQARDFAGVHIAWCQKCFARVGLWLYSESSETAAPADDDDPMKFDPIMLHRTHCPWQNPISQRGLGSYSGHAAWEIVAELLGLEASRDERRRSVRIEEAAPDRDEEDEDDDEQLPLSRESRDETERQDQERETRLNRLKRAFTVKNTIKKPRPMSSRSTKSFLSTKSFHRREDSNS
jgi:hypothetical protein